MNRRAFVRWLGLAPVAAPAVLADIQQTPPASTPSRLDVTQTLAIDANLGAVVAGVRGEIDGVTGGFVMTGTPRLNARPTWHLRG